MRWPSLFFDMAQKATGSAAASRASGVNIPLIQPKAKSVPQASGSLARRQARDSTSPAKKKSKKHQNDADERIRPDPAMLCGGACVCSACGCRASSGSKWARSGDVGAERRREPLGDKCHKCATMHAEGWNFLDWAGFCAMEQTQAGQEDIAEFAKTKAGAETTWIPEAVTSSTRVAFELQRSVVVLSEKEYVQTFGKKVPGARGPVLQTLQLPCEADPSSTATHYVFADESQPHRRCILKTSYADAVDVERLARNGNCYERHGLRTMEQAKIDRQTQLRAQELLKSLAGIPFRRRTHEGSQCCVV